MDSYRDRHDHQAPEVVDQNYPEAVPAQQYPYHNTQHQQYPPKPEDGTSTYASGTTPYSAYSGSHIDHTSPRPYHAVPAPPADTSRGDGKKDGLLCGCSTLVVVLGAIIAALFVAVVGLAAGTGVQANRANVAEAQVNSMSSASMTTVTVAMQTVTTTPTIGSVSATGTSFAAIDDNCSEDPDGVSGTSYSAFSLIGGGRSFTVHCNADAQGSPLLQLFTSDIKTCMDACAAFSQDIPNSFGSNSNATCGAVSFIPAWTNKTVALEGTAPGNCYLKPLQTTAPKTPNIGTPCHAGILN